MASFDEREAAFEKKFALEGDRRFIARVKRDRRVGLWAARLLNLGEGEWEAYAATFAQASIGKSDDAVARDLLARFAAASAPMDDDRIRRKIASAQAEADAAERT
jgi:hypothetical protein